MILSLCYYFFSKQLIIIIFFFLLFALFLLFLQAGFIVLKSLFNVAADLSLLLLLSQSYCNISNRPPSSDTALQGILFIGLLYVIVEFIGSLRKALKEYFKNTEYKEKKNDKIIITLIFILFAVWILYAISLVIIPIVNDSCVYKK
jgi:ABC-type multidrug transport system permease subunit